MMSIPILLFLMAGISVSFNYSLFLVLRIEIISSFDKNHLYKKLFLAFSI